MIVRKRDRDKIDEKEKEKSFWYGIAVIHDIQDVVNAYCENEITRPALIIAVKKHLSILTEKWELKNDKKTEPQIPVSLP